MTKLDSVLLGGEWTLLFCAAFHVANDHIIYNQDDEMWATASNEHRKNLNDYGFSDDEIDAAIKKHTDRFAYKTWVYNEYDELFGRVHANRIGEKYEIKKLLKRDEELESLLPY